MVGTTFTEHAAQLNTINDKEMLWLYTVISNTSEGIKTKSRMHSGGDPVKDRKFTNPYKSTIYNYTYLARFKRYYSLVDLL